MPDKNKLGTVWGGGDTGKGGRHRDTRKCGVRERDTTKKQKKKKKKKNPKKKKRIS